MANISLRYYARSREEAESIVRRVYVEYHPMGYGTSLRIDELDTPVEVRGQTMRFLVSGSRQSSCD